MTVYRAGRIRTAPCCLDVRVASHILMVHDVVVQYVGFSSTMYMYTSYISRLTFIQSCAHEHRDIWFHAGIWYVGMLRHDRFQSCCHLVAVSLERVFYYYCLSAHLCDNVGLVKARGPDPRIGFTRWIGLWLACAAAPSYTYSLRSGYWWL